MILQVNDVIRTVSEVTGISPSLIYSRDRSEPVVMARFMVYYVLYYILDMGCFYVGKELGRTHAAVLNGLRVARSWNKNNPLRDQRARENGAMLEQIMNKLLQFEYAYKFRTTDPITGKRRTEKLSK